MFLHLSVILFTGGICPSACWGTHTSPPGADPLEQTPRAEPPEADTPQSRPPGPDHSWSRPPWNRSPPPGADHPEQLLLQTARILPECILVLLQLGSAKQYMHMRVLFHLKLRIENKILVVMKVYK